MTQIQSAETIMSHHHELATGKCTKGKTDLAFKKILQCLSKGHPFQPSRCPSSLLLQTLHLKCFGTITSEALEVTVECLGKGNMNENYELKREIRPLTPLN